MMQFGPLSLVGQRLRVPPRDASHASVSESIVVGQVIVRARGQRGVSDIEIVRLYAPPFH
jgi:hypothetical protein